MAAAIQPTGAQDYVRALEAQVAAAARHLNPPEAQPAPEESQAGLVPPAQIKPAGQ